MKNPQRVGQGEDDWAMPFGDSIYTHAPDAPSMMTGSASTLPGKRKRKPRRIGFRPPGDKK